MTIKQSEILKKNFKHHVNKMYKVKDWPLCAWSHFSSKINEVKIPVGEKFELVCFGATCSCAIYFILKYKNQYWNYCDINMGNCSNQGGRICGGIDVKSNPYYGDYGCTCDTVEYGLKRFNLIADEVENDNA